MCGRGDVKHNQYLDNYIVYIILCSCRRFIISNIATFIKGCPIFKTVSQYDIKLFMNTIAIFESQQKRVTYTSVHNVDGRL